MYFKVTLVKKGNRFTSVHETDNKRSASLMAKKEHPGAVVVKTEETSAPLENIFANFAKDMKKRSKGSIKIDQKIATIRQIAVMVDAGIPVHDTLNDVAINTQSKRLQEIYSKISQDINAGRSMSEGMEPYAEEFGRVTVAMTKLGESTGNISGAYNKLADILEDIRDNTAKFKKAIRTPLITLAAMGIAFTVLIMVVVPKFRKIFEQLHAELPMPTKILLALEYAFTNYGLYILLGLILAVYMFIYFYKNNKNFQYWVDRTLIHPRFYLMNKVIFLSTMHKYTLIFGELVRSGIPVSEALGTAVEMVDNLYIKEKLLTVNANIGRGMSLGDSFEQTGLFENMLLQMIRAGEAGGQLDQMLSKVTDYYDMRFQDIIDNLAAYIEPIMMFFIAGLVLLMALGIFLPMWDLGSAVKS
jgi:type II secretory pathway component PulF